MAHLNSFKNGIVIKISKQLQTYEHAYKYKYAVTTISNRTYNSLECHPKIISQEAGLVTPRRQNYLLIAVGDGNRPLKECEGVLTYLCCVLNFAISGFTERIVVYFKTTATQPKEGNSFGSLCMFVC